jgi:hypothetical protein
LIKKESDADESGKIGEKNEELPMLDPANEIREVESEKIPS